MSNPIVHGLEVAGKDILKVVEFPFVHSLQFVKILGDALTQEPKVRQAVIDLVKAGEKVAADGLADISAKGLNIETDMQTIADLQTWFKIFQSEFVPAVSAACKLISADAE